LYPWRIVYSKRPAGGNKKYGNSGKHVPDWPSAASSDLWYDPCRLARQVKQFGS
jgi:hypothetical protein